MVGIRYHVLDGRQWVGRWRDINFAMKFSMRFSIPCVSFPYSNYYFFFSFPLSVSFWFPLSFTFFFSLCSLFFTFSFYHFTSPHSTICPPDSSRTYPASTPYRPSHSVSFCAAVASASYPPSSITIVPRKQRHWLEQLMDIPPVANCLHLNKLVHYFFLKNVFLESTWGCWQWSSSWWQ